MAMREVFINRNSCKIYENAVKSSKFMLVFVVVSST